MRTGALILTGVLLTSGPSAAQESPSGLFRAEVTLRAGAQRFPESNGWEGRVLDRDGNLRYLLSREIPFDIQFPSLRLSDEGWCVLSSGNEGWVEWYDADGKPAGTLEPFASPGPDYERIVKTAVGRAHAGLLVSEPGSPEARVLLTDDRGGVLWTRMLGLPNAAEIALSEDGRFLVAGAYDGAVPPREVTVLFDGDGQEAWAREGSFRYADIDPAGKRILLADRNTVTIVPASSPDPEGVWRSGRREQVVTGVRWAGDRAAVAVEEVSLDSGVPMYVTSTLLLLDRTGAVLDRRDVAVPSAHPSALRVEADRVELRSPAGPAVAIPLSQSR
jgi:hypothetical protein